jgi:hypothetical protein
MIIDEEEFEEQYDDYEEEDAIEEEDDSTEELPPIVREDKIFNNRYNTGDGLPDADEYRMTGGINVSGDYSDSYLRDLYEYEEVLETRFILDTIFSFIQTDPMISEILKTSAREAAPGRIKLSKDEVNFIFNRINSALDLPVNEIVFYSPIYILEAISALSSIEYKKLFDMLETEIQELLLIELNKKYNFLDGKIHKKRYTNGLD